jgi:hypothetical protein
MLDFVNNNCVLNQKKKKNEKKGNAEKCGNADIIKWLEQIEQRTHNQELVGSNHAIHWGNVHCYIEKKKKEQA